MSVYSTNWWIKTQPELRKVYVLIILRANKLEELTAGGMLSLNLDGFRKVSIELLILQPYDIVMKIISGT